MDPKEFPILYVDDEHANRIVMKHNLGPQFTLLMAESAAQALQIMSQESVAVLLTDQRMPGITGVDLAEQVLERHPDVVRVIITAYSDLDATIDAINRARVNRFIKKPWTREELAAVMLESIQSYHNNQVIKSLQHRLVQLDRVTAVAIMASAIAHDMRQPLAFIEPTLASLKLDVENLQRRRHTEAQLRERMEDMADQLADLGKGIDRFKLMINTLFNSLKNQPVKTEPLDLRKVVESAVLITRGTIIRRAGFKLDLPPEPVMMMASEGRLVQLVVNLLLNATQAITQGNQMTNTIGLVVSVGETTVAISVSDTGCGITPQNLEQIFAPFFTTKGESGSGLGLPICKQIVEEMQGKMEVQSEVGQGTTFRVTLPRGEAEAQG